MRIRPAITSLSLGRAPIHELPNKLQQAASHGFEGIELFYEDLEYLARDLPGGLQRGNLLKAASQVKDICVALGLEILNLQPFWFYEGLLDRAEHYRLLSEKLPLWFEICHTLNTHTILIPSNSLPPNTHTGKPQTTGNLDVIISDLQDLAVLGLKESPPVQFAYESLAWGNHVNTWDQSWEIVMKVNQPNFGICLDTFNIAARVYADPALPTGIAPNGDADLRASIFRLVRTVNVNKIFSVQIADGERLSSPLIEGHEWHVKSQPSRMSWSRNARLFPYEHDRGAYLPVGDIIRALLDLGFEGWMSMEIFSCVLANPNPKTPEELAKRGIASWKELIKELQ